MIITQLQICIAVCNAYAYIYVKMCLQNILFLSVLAEDAIKAALSDYRLKQDKNRTEDKESVQAKN